MATNCVPGVFDYVTPTDKVTGINEQPCCPEHESAADLGDQNDLISEITLKFSETVEKTTGLSLNTTKTGHFIKCGSEIGDRFDLNLKDNDRLLAINDKTIIYWNHWLVLECLRYLMYFAEQCEHISIIIDRQEDDGSIEEYEICITVMRTREKYGDESSDIEVDIDFTNAHFSFRGLSPRGQHYEHYINGDAYLEIKSLLKRITYVPRLRSVEFKDLYQCRIRHGARQNCYMKVNNERKLVMETLNNQEEDIWKFDCYVYKAMRYHANRDRAPSTVFICVLRSCHSFDGTHPYIMAKNCEKIGITFFRTLELDDSRTERVDPRFFRVTKTSNGLSMFESLIYRNYYLTWNNLSEKPKLAKHTREEICAFADSLYKCQFEILKI